MDKQIIVLLIQVQIIVCKAIYLSVCKDNTADQRLSNDSHVSTTECLPSLYSAVSLYCSSHI